MHLKKDREDNQKYYCKASSSLSRFSAEEITEIQDISWCYLPHLLSADSPQPTREELNFHPETCSAPSSPSSSSSDSQSQTFSENLTRLLLAKRTHWHNIDTFNLKRRFVEDWVALLLPNMHWPLFQWNRKQRVWAHLKAHENLWLVRNVSSSQMVSSAGAFSVL